MFTCSVIEALYWLSREVEVWSLPSIQASHVRRGAPLLECEGSHPHPQLEARDSQQRGELKYGPTVPFPEPSGQPCVSPEP